MNKMTFRSDTVLSDIHIAKKQHFMVRLNADGQPVFLSQFKLLLDNDQCNFEKEGRDFKKSFGWQSRAEEKISAEEAVGAQDSPGTAEKDGVSWLGIEALLDEDGDLEVVRKVHSRDEDITRAKTCPIILTKGGYILEEQEHNSEHCNDIKIVVQPEVTPLPEVTPEVWHWRQCQPRGRPGPSVCALEAPRQNGGAVFAAEKPRFKEHTMATPLEDVGKQVWRGAFLLADYILCRQNLFKNCTVLELGGGTGIVSIVMAKAAKTVYCTDIGEDLLDMCERNISLNRHFTEPTDPDESFSWSEKEIMELHDLTTVIIAADVFYDDNLTDAFFKTLYKITSNLRNPCTIYISVEKRFNFTLRHMDVVCEAYSHFRSTLDELLNIRGGKMRYTIESVQLSFPQHIVYERVPQLELWKLSAEKISQPPSE